MHNRNLTFVINKNRTSLFILVLEVSSTIQRRCMNAVLLINMIKGKGTIFAVFHFMK